MNVVGSKKIVIYSKWITLQQAAEKNCSLNQMDYASAAEYNYCIKNDVEYVIYVEECLISSSKQDININYLIIKEEDR